MSQFESTLKDLLSPDRYVRENAEKVLEDLIKSSPEAMLHNLITTIPNTNEDIGNLSAILIRQKFVDQSYLKFISNTMMAKNKLLELITPRLSSKTLKRIGDILIYFSVLYDWESELIRLAASWSSSDYENIKELGLYVFEVSVLYASFFRYIQENSSPVSEILLKSLQVNNRKIVISAVKALCSIITGLPQDLVQNFSICFDLAVNDAIQYLDVISFNKITEVTEIHPIIWQGKLQKLVNLVSVAKNHKNSSELRIAALEIYVELVKSGSWVTKSAYFLQEAATIGFILLAEPEKATDFEGWCKDLDLDYIESPFKSGLELLKSLKSIPESMPYIKDLIFGHLEGNHWVHKNAGLTACQLIDIADLNTLIQLSNTHPRLQWTLLKTIGMQCIESTTIQDQNAIILNLITDYLSHHTDKILSQALNCLSLYLTSKKILIEKTIEPYLADICTNMYKILGNNNLLKQALSTLSLLISSTGEMFLPYCEKFYPGLKFILQSNCNTFDQQEIRAECIRTIGSVCEIMVDLVETNNVFNEILMIKNSVQEENPCVYAVWDVVPMFAASLKGSFCTYLDALVPELLYRVGLDIDIHLVGTEKLMPGYGSIEFNIKGLGSKFVAINTLKLQAKIKASETIYKLISITKENYINWTQPTVSSILSLLSYPYSPAIKRNVMKSLSLIPLCGNAEHLVLEIVLKFLDALKNHSRMKLNDVYETLKYLYKILENINNAAVIGISNAQILSEVLVDILNALMTRKNFKYQEINVFEVENCKSQAKGLSLEDEIDEEIIRIAMELAGVLLKSFAKSFQMVFLDPFKVIYSEILYKKYSSEGEILSSLCFFADYIEYTGDLFIQNFSCPILDQFIKHCYHSDALIRHTSAFGIGLYAQSESDVFEQYSKPAIESLNYILNLDSNSPTEVSKVTYESAAGALGKIATTCRPDLIPFWLSHLPFRFDPQEAKEAHHWFLTNLTKLTAYKSLVLPIINQLKFINPDYLLQSSKDIINSLV